MTDDNRKIFRVETRHKKDTKNILVYYVKAEDIEKARKLFYKNYPLLRDTRRLKIYEVDEPEEEMYLMIER